MKRIMTRRGLAMALALALAMAPVAGQPVLAQSETSISGTYRAAGMNPDGTKYSGRVQIAEQGSIVAINWQIASQSYSGRGIRDGRVVTVDWGADTPVVYVVMANGELHGTWDNGAALERLIPQ